MGTIMRNGRTYGIGLTTDIIAENYDPTTTYHSGSFCIHDGLLYVHRGSTSTTGEWDPNAWESGPVCDAITAVEHALTLLAQEMLFIKSVVTNSADAYSENTNYYVGDHCVHNAALYECITDCTAASWETNSSCFTTTTLVNSVKKLFRPTFTEASTRANIASGDTFSTILGKIKKFFTDLKTVAFTGAYSDLSGTENVAYKNANNRFSASQVIDKKDGTTTVVGTSWLDIGNATPSGTAGNSQGAIALYSKGTGYAAIKASNVTGGRNIELPDKDGTLAMTSDLEGDTDVYVGHDTFNITLKRTPALIMFRPSGNDVRVLIAVTDAGKAFVLFDYNNLHTVTVNSCTGNVVNVTTTQFCGYAVIY